MNVLGIETSGPIGSIALRSDGRCVDERFLPELGRRHAQSLVPEIVDLLARHRLTPADLGAVAVSVGPGSFTGLRVGVTFAKMLAYATGARLAAVETFAAIAENTPSVESLALIADAQRGGLILGIYDREPADQFTRRGDMRMIRPEDLPSSIAGVPVLTGPGVEREGLRFPSGVEIPAEHLRRPRAAAVALLGERQLARGTDADPWTLEPLYVRRSGAEEKLVEQR